MSVADYESVRSMAHRDGDDEDKNPKMKVDLIDIIETQGEWGHRTTVTLTADIHKAKGEKQGYQEYAIILRRLRDRHNIPKSTRLEIQSPIIRSCLQEVLEGYPTINMNSDPIILDKPFAPLFHYRKDLLKYAASEDRTEEEKSHMDILVEFMKKYLKETKNIYDKLILSELTTYDLLWTLFRPEEVVIAQRDHFTEAYVVDSCSVTDVLTDGEIVTHLSLIGRQWDYNGTRFGHVTTGLIIKRFFGNKKIRDLEVYPIAYHVEADSKGLRERLIARGLKWRSILDVTHREYDALAWADPLSKVAENINELVPIHTSGRIILDYGTHQQAKPQFATMLSRASITKVDENKVAGIHDILLDDAAESEAIKAKKAQYKDAHASYLNNDSYIMTEAQALLAPARVRGFSLTDKMWAFFLVDEVKEIKWAEKSFETLRLEEKFKNTIYALVRVHSKRSRQYEQFEDVIAGKGKGLIFLLTGPRGLSKTLTAESIAEETKKPLYTITSGELGTDVVQTDQSLRRIFTRAKTWNAILLLDEADVFLAKRDRKGLQRNAFVSVFLRLIEYYQGILFLTTNRVDEFDEAFQSRIRLTIHYQPQDDGGRTTIWRNLLSRIESKAWNEDILERLGRSYKINGREINNLIQTAAALAEHEEVPLAERHIETVYGLNTMVQPIYPE
ncbi:hypothetical protein VE04_01226 [Pseudogymnoascus sp. 24MN13]|nr:hypothetical protein VE04_01226 [Pseudogymnoascus sp. 24MN13]